MSSCRVHDGTFRICYAPNLLTALLAVNKPQDMLREHDTDLYR